MDTGQGQDRNDSVAGGARGGSPWLGRGLLVGGVVLGLLFLTVGAIALVLVAGPSGKDGEGGRAADVERFEERYVSGEGVDKIAILPITGVISSQESSSLESLETPTATPETLRNELRQAARDDSVKAVILEVNSPGGSVVASDQMHNNIQDFKESTGKPVVVSMGETAASGGYYISTAADEIIANESTFTGSLGVIFSILNYKDAEEKLGIEEEVFKSDEFKDLFSGSRERTPEEKEIIQNLINESYDQFVEVIVEGRGLPEDKVREIADGRVYSGSQAESLGLVDYLGDLDYATGRADELAGIEDATAVRYRKGQGILGLLRARLAPPESEALKALRVAGISPTPELQYLYRP